MSLGVVARKELLEQFSEPKRAVALLAGSSVFDVLLLIGLPLGLNFTATARADAPTVVAVAATFLVLVAVMAFKSLMGPLQTVVDALAGERERHTLEGLLATPVSRSDLFWGKAIGVLVPVVAGNVVTALVGLVLLAVFFGGVGFAFGLLLLVAAPLVALVGGSVLMGYGLWASARAATVKQGSQWLAFAMLPILLLVPALALSRSFAVAFSPQAQLLVVLGGFAIALLLGVAANLLFWILAYRATTRERLLLRVS